MNPAPTRIRRSLPPVLLVATACPLLLGVTPVPAVAGPAASGETRVNTSTSGDHTESDVAVDADGDYVVVWSSSSADGSGNGVHAQRFNAAGTPQGPETLVNTTTLGTQFEPSVAMSADGGYVVTWTSGGQDGDDYGVYSQRYDAAGRRDGTETRVNTTTFSLQSDSQVAMDADGDYVVTWTSAGQDGEWYGVFAQRYDATGTPRGDETLVNSTTANDQYLSHVAMDADGDYVVTWTSAQQDGSGDGVYAQRYDAAGTRRGSETRVNTFTNSGQSESEVAMDADGDYVITWAGDGGVGSVYDVFAQRYNASGVPQGGETRVNTTTPGNQRPPTVGMDADGDYVIAWTSIAAETYSVHAQRYAATGTAQGTETRVSTTAGHRFDAALALDADGDHVITWTSSGQDGSGRDIYSRRFRAPVAIDLAITQADNVDPVAVDGRVTYRVRAANLNEPVEDTGVEGIDSAIGAASGVYVVSAVPDGATFLSSSGAGWTCGAPTTTVKCKLATTIRAGDVAPGLLLTYQASDTAGPALHQARVYEAQVDPVPANNVEVERTSVMCAIEFADPYYSRSESKSVTATVTRHGTNCGTSSVHYDSAPGTAALGADFTDVAGALTWTDADTTQTFTVPLVDDTLDENTERFRLSLGNPVGVLLGGNDLVTASIGDNDEAPRINFTTSGATRSEPGLAVATLRLSEVSGQAVTVTLGRGGTATSGSDYFAPTRITIPAGQRTAELAIEVADDEAVEGTETATLTLTNPVAVTLGSLRTFQLTINDNE